MTTNNHHPKRRDKSRSATNSKNSPPTKKVSSSSAKESKSASTKRSDILPQPNGGIQRISLRPVYRKRPMAKIPVAVRHKIDDPCPLCLQSIGDDPTAIKFGKNQDPAHFNCVLTWLEQNEVLAKGEKIAYIGAGKFAVILHDPKAKSAKLTIVRYLSFSEENTHTQPLWKRNLAITPELLVASPVRNH
jgi:hypothetical protein